MALKACRPGREKLRPLTKHEIDRKIEGLVADVAALVEDDGTAEGDPFRPRWISTSELVVRMRPFLVWN